MTEMIAIVIDTYGDLSEVSAEDGSAWLEFDHWTNSGCYTPAQARELAAALTTAADVAEGNAT